MFYNNRIQIALFFNNFNERPDLYFYDLNKSLENIFDKPPINIPVPPNAPKDIPLLQAVSSNNMYSLQISGTRIDFTLNNQNMNDASNDKADKFYKLAMKFVEHVLSIQQIFRFGYVSTTIKTEGNPIQSLKKKYFSKGIENPNELSIRFNNQRKKDTMIINDIVNMESAFANINNVNKHILIITRDINNVLEQGKILKDRDVKGALESFYNDLLVEKVKELI